MALGFGSAQRLERILLKTRSILGEGDAQFNLDNKTQALQFAAAFNNLYAGDGSEVTYTDAPNLTILQSELIATAAAIELIKSAISYYKDDVVQASGGPASASFRSDKLDWLRELLKELEDKMDDLKDATGIIGDPELALMEGFFLKKVRACKDPADDVCPDTCSDPTKG